MSPFNSISEVYEGLISIKESFDDRIEFYTTELEMLQTQYVNFMLKETAYLRKLCPLQNERRRINADYKALVSNYIETVPPIYIFEDILMYFDCDIV